MANETAESRPSVRYIDVSDAHEGQRIDNFLLRELKGVPKSRVYRLLRRGEVRVNKSRVKPEYKLCNGDVVRVPPVRVAESGADKSVSGGLESQLSNSVLFENDALLVINKPSGLAVHGGSGIQVGLIEALRMMRPEARFLELVHRLDRDTSGCVMIAKKRSMLRFLHQQLREGHIDKRYLALVSGRWPNRRKLVSAALMKNTLQSGERVVRVSPDGKQSRTEFSIIERFEKATLVEAKPITGRTHQIRVHALHVGHPLLGDDKYGDKHACLHFRSLGLKRLFLHAASLTLSLSEGESKIRVQAPLPVELQDLLGVLK